MKILLIRLEDFTSVLLATPLIRCLHEQLAPAEIHVLTGSEGHEALTGNPYLSRVHSWDYQQPPPEAFRRERFAVQIDLQNNPYSRSLAAHLNRPLLKASLRSEGWRRAIPFSGVFSPRHLANRYFAAVDRWGVINDGAGLDFFIPESRRVTAQDIPASHYAGFLGIAIENTGLPVATLQELCRRIRHPLMLVGSKNVQAEGEAIATADPVKIYNACGKFSLYETADLLRQSKVVLAGRSVPMHLAVALKKPLLVLGSPAIALPADLPYYSTDYKKQHPLFSHKVYGAGPFIRTRRLHFIEEVVADLEQYLYG